MIGSGGGTIDNNDGALAISGDLTGTGHLVFKSTGGFFDGNDYDSTSVALTGTNSYSGGTTVRYGAQIQVKVNDALGSGSLQVDQGAVVDLAGFSQHVTSLTGGGEIAGTGARDGETNSVTIETLTVQSGNYSGPLNWGNYFISTEGGYQTVDYGDIDLVKTTSGTLTLTGNNSYGKFGGRTLLQAGTIAVGSDNALGASTLSMSAGTTLQSVTGVKIYNAISLNGADTFETSGSGSATPPYSGGMEIVGVISGTGELIKTGEQ